MRKHYFIYGIAFPKRDIEIGLFVLEMDFFEGETEDNAAQMVQIICKKNGWNVKAVRNYTFRKVSDNFLKSMFDETSFLRRPGDDGSRPQSESDGGTGGG